MSIETPTKIGIISDALVLLGEKPLNSLSDDRYGATVGAALFELLYENELQGNRWRFAMKKAALSQLVSDPLNEWTHAYQLPSDCLLPIGVYPPVDYEIYGDHLYSNAATIELDYMFKPDVSELPAYFVALLTYALALNMAKSITESGDAVERFRALYVFQRDRAMFADAQGRPNRSIRSHPFTAIR